MVFHDKFSIALAPMCTSHENLLIFEQSFFECAPL